MTRALKFRALIDTSDTFLKRLPYGNKYDLKYDVVSPLARKVFHLLPKCEKERKFK
jgi:hypothetical protein